MKENRPFIGMGDNPNGPMLPTGLSMQLAQNPEAMARYGTLSDSQKSSLINYVQGGATGDEAKARITSAIDMLGQNRVSFS